VTRYQRTRYYQSGRSY